MKGTWSRSFYSPLPGRLEDGDEGDDADEFEVALRRRSASTQQRSFAIRTLNSCFLPMRAISRSSTAVPPFWRTPVFPSSLPMSSIEMRSSGLISAVPVSGMLRSRRLY